MFSKWLKLLAERPLVSECISIISSTIGKIVIVGSQPKQYRTAISD